MAVCFHTVPGLKPGKPCYALVSEVRHSSSFQPFYEVFGFVSTKTEAKRMAKTVFVGNVYPYTVEKPEIAEVTEDGELV